ncbi:accessory Sec system translocase SecA2 [Paenibacillus sambharensis]|uniref:Protein translocase subunit SecA n=1 Tax=Paenibacillus sambharensis TaxID=1803190 RepID=A0A2W1L117_9BACL|nr:DEAD/DEAH box helicase [Paenibacillus sambharensis]PZD93618.1 accessory Sec system translocase SecA2 [Paenibacillus sambharensis]
MRYRLGKAAGGLNRLLNARRLRAYERRLSRIRSFKALYSSAPLLNEQIKILRWSAEDVRTVEKQVRAAAVLSLIVQEELDINLYDEQLIAGMAMHEGYMIDMKTGEGKTLAALLPAFLSVLEGKQVHIYTFNEYLAERDCMWCGPVFNRLGFRVSGIKECMNKSEKREAYAADVVYVTARQAGYDWLNDSLVYEPEDLVQRPLELHDLIVDEADGILLDEARVPMVIAGESSEVDSNAYRVRDIAVHLQNGADYQTDEARRNVFLTDEGCAKAEAMLKCGNLYELRNADLLADLHSALHVEALLVKDIDYIVCDGKLVLIDEFTGRAAENRQLPDSLQSALEAKEGLKNRSTGIIWGTLTAEHLVKRYAKLAGMSGTAALAADELKDIYGLETLIIPTHSVCRRVDEPHLIFSHKEAKFRAIMTDISDLHRLGKPLLIGTSSVEASERLAADLEAAGIRSSVINARHDKEEAALLSKAGRLGAVTVATHMAGRGVDIHLGGGDPLEAEQVRLLGGLHVIGTELHDSQRIDWQLRGRAGRQGEPGYSRYYVSLEDSLLLRYGLQESLPASCKDLRQEAPLNDNKLGRIVDHIQRVAEGQHHETRKTLAKYADLLEQYCREIRAKRDRFLYRVVQPNIWVNTLPELFAEALNRFGDETTREAERYAMLACIDRCWADFLAYAAYVKEGIHLESIGGRNPLEEYTRLMSDAYASVDDKIKAAVGQTLHNNKNVESLLDGIKQEVRVPSATWTYLINDQFFPERVSLI